MKALGIITYIMACLPYAALIIYRKEIAKGLKETARLLFTEEYDNE